SIIAAALKRKVERETMKKKEFDNVNEALGMVQHFREEILHTNPCDILLSEIPKIRCEFNSIREFNRFSFEIGKFGNVSIDDVYVFENKYIITISILPPGSFKMR
ncbi:MAG: hypothetical protein V1726_00025, partial [Methanobacteriota archaeon]